MKKVIIVIIVLLVFGAGGYYLYQKNQVKAPKSETEEYEEYQLTPPANNQPTSDLKTPSAPAPKATSTPAGTFSSGEEQPDGPNIQVAEVDYDGTQFTPNPVSIKVNDWVFFKNNSSKDMRVASNPHPEHTDYPGFDSVDRIAPGRTYKFQFTKVGSWGYHDHLNHSVGGTVVVGK